MNNTLKIHKGDTVIVTVGKDKNQKGKVEKVFPKLQSVLVTGVNMIKRHMKKKDEKNPGGIIDITKPIDVSKVSLLCPKCNKQTRVGFHIVKGEKVRICRKCDQKI